MAGRSIFDRAIWRRDLRSRLIRLARTAISAGMSENRAAYVTLNPSRGRKALGWGFIILGILGCVLPFLQGFLFIALGVFVLREQYLWAANRWAWVEERWPRAVGKVESMEQSVNARVVGWAIRLRRAFSRSSAAPRRD
jgi:hypothetical protein